MRVRDLKKRNDFKWERDKWERDKWEWDKRVRDKKERHIWENAFKNSIDEKGVKLSKRSEEIKA